MFLVSISPVAILAGEPAFLKNKFDYFRIPNIFTIVISH